VLRAAGPGGQDVPPRAPGQPRRSRHQKTPASRERSLTARTSAARGRLREPTKRRRLTQPGATPPGPPGPSVHALWSASGRIQRGAPAHRHGSLTANGRAGYPGCARSRCTALSPTSIVAKPWLTCSMPRWVRAMAVECRLAMFPQPLRAGWSDGSPGHLPGQRCEPLIDRRPAVMAG